MEGEDGEVDGLKGNFGFSLLPGLCLEFGLLGVWVGDVVF